MSASEFLHLNQRDPSVPAPPGGFDPLRLCVFTTIAVISDNGPVTIFRGGRAIGLDGAG